MQPDVTVVAFADVDGILFDGSVPAFEAAAGACALLAEHGIPLVFCSGRTRAQIECVQRSLGITYPFICEHGAAAFVPAGYFPDRVPNAREVAGCDAIEFGRPYVETVETLQRTAGRLRLDVIGFHEMSVEQVATAWGLPLLEARLAKLREYSEPFRILGDGERAQDRLFKALRAAGLGCVRGDPYHYAGAPTHREAAIALIEALYARAWHRPVLTVGFGNTVDHVPMLRQVQVPVLVGKATSVASPEALTVMRHGRCSAVAAWARAIHAVAQRLAVSRWDSEQAMESRVASKN